MADSPLDERLGALLQVRGVTAAVVADAEGLLVAVRRAAPLDSEALAASARVVLHMAEQAHELGATGPVELVASEGPGGSLLIAPLGDGKALAVAIAAGTMVGAVRFALRTATQEIRPLVGG